MIKLRSRAISATVNPELGGEIVELGRLDSENVLSYANWRSPVRASSGARYVDSRADWLSDYRGGWQELIPNVGQACRVQGADLPFHGEASRAAWDVIEEGPRSITLATSLRLPLIVRRSMTVDESRAVLRIEEEVENDSDLVVRFLWAHHPAFDLGPGTLIDLPATRLAVEPTKTGDRADLLPGAEGDWPQCPGRDGRVVDLRLVPTTDVDRLVYLPGLAFGWAALRNATTGIGVGLAWDLTTFRHAWLWQQRGRPDFPFYGRGSLVAIEPQTCLSFSGLATAIEDGDGYLEVGGRARRFTWLTAVLFAATDRPVENVARDGTIKFGRAK